LLDKNGRNFEIENFLLEEDKAVDPLDDEQFPGMVFARVKMYSKDPTDNIPKNIFKGIENNL